MPFNCRVRGMEYGAARDKGQATRKFTHPLVDLFDRQAWPLRLEAGDEAERKQERCDISRLPHHDLLRHN